MEPSVFKSILGDLVSFADRYARLFGQPRLKKHAVAYLRGLLGPSDRKSVEPMALEEEFNVRTLQHFIGQARWRDERVLKEHQRHVSETLGRADGVIVFDGSSFPKQGNHSVGVARQWCGNRGKEENCQVGMFLGYASERGHTLLDRRLYLPKAWTQDVRRRRECHVPDVVEFKTGWELAWEMYQEARRAGMPHAWVTGDEEFGKVQALADFLHAQGQAYIFEVPSDTSVYTRPPHYQKARRQYPRGRPAWKPLQVGGVRPPVDVRDVMARVPGRDWTLYRVREGEKGPLEVEAVRLQVWLSRDLAPGRPAWLIITRGRGPDPELKYFLAEASWRLGMPEFLRAAFSRWPIEQCFEQGKQELGMDQYETRSWAGWHHHMTMVILAHHFLVLERQKRGKKGGGTHGRGNRPGHESPLGTRRRPAKTAVPEDSLPDPGAQTGSRVSLPQQAPPSPRRSATPIRIAVPNVA